MLTTQRKQRILEQLAAEGQVLAKQLSEAFGVSEDTIRRDLRELASEGRLQRVHGGALPASGTVVSFEARSRIATGAKHQLARVAAAMILPGQVVMIDGGTTSGELVKSLPLTLTATVVTHSPSVAVALVNHPGIEVVLIGGRLYKHSLVAVGAAAVEALATIRADVFFMGVAGVHPQAGFSTGDLEEAYIKRALAARAAETVVMATQDKLNVASRYAIGELAMASTLIVESTVPDDVTAPFAQAGLSVIRA
ncbi:DeoR/GlpR family DNA-binding transcription regulator [Dickeya fangzhongdai]|uniref:DeoR/GlpR family DNA-binding transcription regulator n=1 Tax=Dickeya fangzhongdai TaxID=1778540 RepID=UPI0004F5DFEE|nr:DeoR/GlpR family DNA-binding transcription regulator [Dickeya fangzhongdai]AIR68117.1 DeoR faimly transcriptional regulator [Dickeya fangzhongdai]KGT97230.1 DeoR faimly transcriptional regulator [Dickeya fangzhongdai]